MRVEEKLEELDKKEWSDVDREVIHNWRQALRSVRIAEDYLNMDQTQAIIKVLKQTIIEIDSHLTSIVVIEPSQITTINSDIARKKVYEELLSLFQVDNDFESEKKEIESHIDKGLEL